MMSEKPDKSLIYPLFIPMQGCQTRCIYCDQYAISGAGKLNLEDAALKVQAFIRRNRHKSKEIALYGGSFTALAASERHAIYEAILPEFDENTSLRISTHPAFIDAEIAMELREKRVKTVELGVQDFCDEVLIKSRRGYTQSAAVNAVRLLQEAGFKLGVQLMPGLPGSGEHSIKENMALLQKLKPEYLRLYPVIVIKNTELAKRYLAGKYQALQLKEASAICADYWEHCQKFGTKIIKLGLPSNLDKNMILAGPWHPAFGELVYQELLIRKIKANQGYVCTLSTKERNLLRAHTCRFLDEYPAADAAVANYVN